MKNKANTDTFLLFLRALFLVTILMIFEGILVTGCREDSCWVVRKSFRRGELHSIWGIPKKCIYVISGGQLLCFDGNDWQSNSIGTISPSGYGIWATSDDDIFIAHYNGILHFNGTGWTEMMEGSPAFSAIWGASNRDVFAATVWESRIFHCDGVSWTEMETPQSTARYHFLEAIWGSSGTDVYAVGYESDPTSVGRVLHYDGSSWEEVLITEEYARFNAVWGSGTDDVYVSGGGDLYHFNGNEWSHVEVPGYGLYSISGRSATDVVAVGDMGTIVRYDGLEWRDESISSDYDLFGVWTGPGAPEYAVGCKLFDDGNDVFCGDGVFFENTCSSE